MRFGWKNEAEQEGAGKRLFIRMAASIIDSAIKKVVGGQYERNAGEKRLYWDCVPIADHRLLQYEHIIRWP